MTPCASNVLRQSLSLLWSVKFAFSFVTLLHGGLILSSDFFALFGYRGRAQLFFHIQSHPRGHVRQANPTQANCKAFLCHCLSLVQGRGVKVAESVSGR